MFETKIASDHIRIDQTMPRDSMLEPVIITTDKLELPFPENPIQVRKDIFDSLCRYINKAYKDTAPILLREREVNEFGNFKVTMRVGDRSEILFTGTRRKAVSFLTEFSKLLKVLGAPDESVKKTESMLKKIDY
jgi:hypothetical protein